MKNHQVLFTIGFVMMSFGLLTAQETRSVDNFSELSISGAFDVKLIKGTNNSIEMSGDRTDIERVKVKSKGNRLALSMKNKNGLFNIFNRGKSRVEATITYTDELEFLKTSASAYVDHEGTMRTSTFEFDCSSGSKCEFSIKAEKLKVDISSGARVELGGQTERQYVRASSGGSYRAYDLDSSFTNADVSSGGSAHVIANDEIEGDASSGGSIRYGGSPKRTSVHSSSGGSIRSKNTKTKISS